MKQIAEALVECGYADDINEDHIAIAHQCGEFGDDVDWEFRPVQYDADTLEGRRQADALDDWLGRHELELWKEGGLKVINFQPEDTFSEHQWRLDRIKWCFEQLEKDNDT